jgi:hypothetical protein
MAGPIGASFKLGNSFGGTDYTKLKQLLQSWAKWRSKRG